MHAPHNPRDSWEPAPEARPPQEPLPNRFTRSTALGCLGVLGVLVLPGFFFLPLETWHLPQWAIQALELMAFAALAGGIWLLTRVPAPNQPSQLSQARKADAWHPLTHTGRSPLREQPAQPRNRAMVLLVGALALLAAGSYVAASAAAGRVSFGIGVALAGMVGLICVALGALVAGGRLPAPAWGWLRTPIHPVPRPQGIALALFGGAVAGWALLAAAGVGYAWGDIGLALLVLGSVLLPAVVARWPRGERSGRAGGR